MTMGRKSKEKQKKYSSSGRGQTFGIPQTSIEPAEHLNLMIDEHAFYQLVRRVTQGWTVDKGPVKPDKVMIEAARLAFMQHGHELGPYHEIRVDKEPSRMQMRLAAIKPERRVIDREPLYTGIDPDDPPHLTYDKLKAFQQMMEPLPEPKKDKPETIIDDNWSAWE